MTGEEMLAQGKAQAEKFGAVFLDEDVVAVETDDQGRFRVILESGQNLGTWSLILAMGISRSRLKAPGEKELQGKGVSSCAVCDAAFYRDRKVVIVGGGDTAMEDASFLTKFTNKITIVQNLDKLTASAPMQKRVLNNPDIKIIYNSSAIEIIGNKTNLTGIKITHNKTNETQILETDGVFLAVGMIPNNKPFDGHIELDKWGYIKLTNHTTTSVQGIFAAGDIADPVYRQAITSSGSGCMAALDAERYLNTLS